jgi:hypothetical protein
MQAVAKDWKPYLKQLEAARALAQAPARGIERDLDKRFWFDIGDGVQLQLLLAGVAHAQPLLEQTARSAAEYLELSSPDRLKTFLRCIRKAAATLIVRLGTHTEQHAGGKLPPANPILRRTKWTGVYPVHPLTGHYRRWCYDVEHSLRQTSWARSARDMTAVRQAFQRADEYDVFVMVVAMQVLCEQFVKTCDTDGTVDMFAAEMLAGMAVIGLYNCVPTRIKPSFK